MADRRSTEPNAEMSAIGYGIAALNLLVLLPLLPFVAIVVVYDAITGGQRSVLAAGPPEEPYGEE